LKGLGFSRAAGVPQNWPGFSPRGKSLKPAREHATNNAQTYFVSAKTWESRALFRAEPWARLFFQNLLSHRDSYRLHELVLMPHHFHLLISPSIALERAIQFVKGGFSFRAKKELGSNAEIWQRGFADHRIRDGEDFKRHMQYIHLNPVKRHLSERPEQYSYSSAFPGWKLDPIPQGLKPSNIIGVACGTTKVVPFQSIKDSHCAVEAVPFQRTQRSAMSSEIGATKKVEKTNAT
jgi:putative transposase